MAQLTEESLLQAIQKDDIKSFDAQWGRYRLGRFPVLSLLYLYKSRKLLSAYEDSFLKITGYEEKHEPISIYKAFSEKAGKCARLYLSEVVSPLEMLLILDKTRRLKRVYPLVKPSSAVKARLQSIYSIKYSLNIKFEGNEIIIDRRPLSYREKKKIATACLCSVLAVAVAVGVPVTTVALMPEHVEGEVRKLSEIDFNSNKEFTLKKDIVLPENFSVEKVNCKIIGGGKKIIAKKGVTLGQFGGKMSDLIIESCGEPLFTTVSENAEIKNVTINIGADVACQANTALVAVTNYGTIDGVTVNISGKINATAATDEINAELIVGGVVMNNAYRSSQSYGIIKSCTVNYSDFSLIGEGSANATFGGVAGVNRGALQDCTVTGKITADTFDLAGICYGNNGLVSGNINEADLSQTSSDSGWNPIVCGIVIENASTVQNCENKGNISAVSTSEKTEENSIAVSAAGIVNLNGGTLSVSVNSGSVSAAGNGTAIVGGICARSYGSVSYCLSSGDITVNAQSVFAGGILGRCEITADVFNRPIYDFVRFCISENRISVTAESDGEVCAGGVVGFVMEGSYINSEIYFGGGVTGCYFTGERVNDVNCFGNIVGACGANIYESNSYSEYGVEYHNFDGNYYLNNSLPAFGAVIKGESEFVPAGENKGATPATEEDIKNSEGYKKILNSLLKS